MRLVVSQLEVHSSKCSMSYRRPLKRDLLGHEDAGHWWLVRVKVRKRVYCS